MGLLSSLANYGTRRAMRRASSRGHFAFLREHPLLKQLSDRGFLFLHDRIVERRFSKDELIFKQDNLGVCLFIVCSGSVSLEVTTADGEPVLVGRVQEGDIFGEMSVISDNYRTATARADRHDTMLLVLSSFDLRDFRLYHPVDAVLVLSRLTDVICRNLTRVTRELADLRQTSEKEG